MATSWQIRVLVQVSSRGRSSLPPHQVIHPVPLPLIELNGKIVTQTQVVKFGCIHQSLSELSTLFITSKNYFYLSTLLRRSKQQIESSSWIPVVTSVINKITSASSMASKYLFINLFFKYIIGILNVTTGIDNRKVDIPFQ